MLPVRKELLEGLLEADLLGFHTYGQLLEKFLNQKINVGLNLKTPNVMLDTTQ